MKTFLHVTVQATALLSLSGLAAADGPDRPAAAASPPLFAFCFDTHDTQQRSLEEQANMLRELGYAGAGHVGLDALPERLASLDRAGLRLFLTGTAIDLSQPLEPQLSPFLRALPLLEKHAPLLYVTLTGYPPRDPRGNGPGVEALRTLAERAQAHGLCVGIYPHTGDWVVHIDHAIAVAQEVDRPNCGVIFNLCHFLRNEQADTWAAALDRVRPYLQAVMINGADPAGKADPDWQRLIQPLDAGTFDVPELLRHLSASAYDGPIGLMCWGIVADSRDHLQRSIDCWRQWRPAGQ